MRTVSAEWQENQLRRISEPSIMRCSVVTEPRIETVQNPLGPVRFIFGGSLGPFPYYPARGQVVTIPYERFPLAQIAVYAYIYPDASVTATLNLYEYDQSQNKLVRFLCSAENVESTIGDGYGWWHFSLNTPSTRLLLTEGTYAFLITCDKSDAFLVHSGGYNTYQYGYRISATSLDEGTICTPESSGDYYFEFIDEGGRVWEFDSLLEGMNNIVEASFTHRFDPSNATLPFDESTVTIHNGRVSTLISESRYSEDYDFSIDITANRLKQPGTLSCDIGYRLGSSDIFVPLLNHTITDSKVEDDGLTVSISSSNHLVRGDSSVFYKGRYDPNGIGAATLMRDVLEDVQFVSSGKWNYVLGDSLCKTYLPSDPDALTLWSPSGYVYYEVDNALNDVLVRVPLPVVSHREALLMLIAYSGATWKQSSDGRIKIYKDLAEPIDYTFDAFHIYDRPKKLARSKIGLIKSAVHSVSVTQSTTQICSVEVTATTTDPTTYFITHSGATEASLSLSGATLVGTPTYYAYGVEFVATAPSAPSVFTAKVTGKALHVEKTAYLKKYDDGRGEVVEFVNPIASDTALIDSMLERYRLFAETTTFSFKGRDDPAIEAGDRIRFEWIQKEGISEVVPVIVTQITRTFNGGVDADYIVVRDPYR